MSSPSRPSVVGRSILVVLAALLLGAHLLRGWHVAAAVAVALLPALLLVPGRWPRRVVQVDLAAGVVEWIRTLLFLVDVRKGEGRPFARMAVILGAVAVVTALAALAAGRLGRRSRTEAAPSAEPVPPRTAEPRSA